MKDTLEKLQKVVSYYDMQIMVRGEKVSSVANIDSITMRTPFFAYQIIFTLEKGYYMYKRNRITSEYDDVVCVSKSISGIESIIDYIVKSEESREAIYHG